MSPTRRHLLRGIGVGVTISAIGLPAAAGPTERVIVHPRAGAVGRLLTAIDAVDGTVIHRYDNFDFVAAAIPRDRRDELLDDFRVALIEDDGDVGVPSGWFPSLSDILDPRDPADCSTHPDERPSWGWERIGTDAVDADGDGIDVGILDTGIQSDHCSLEVAGGRDFTGTVESGDYEDGHGHGTHVAGIAGALSNDLGVIGVAPASNLYGVKVLDDDGSGSYSSLLAGIDWCMSNDIELISMSLGGESSSAAVDEAIEEATASGHLLLCAAGNEEHSGGGCGDETMTYPATHPDVIAVTAMNEDDSFASYSSVGDAIDIMAPGTDILSTYVGNDYATASGTSMACPFVTGVAAVVWQRRGETGPGPSEEVRTILADTAETVLDSCHEGHGLVDAVAAVTDDRAAAGDDGQTPDGDDPPSADDSRSEDGHSDEPVNDEDDDSSRSVLGWFLHLVRRFIEFILNLFR